MRFRTLARSTLSGCCALTFACSDGGNTPAATAPSDALGAVTDGPALSLFGLGGVGHACRAPEYRQFDFWLGSWQVPSAGPTPSADFITAGLGGCAVFEDWHGAGGSHGRSMSSFDAADQQWHQHWVENFGFFPLRLDGGVVDGKMVMQETYPDPFGTGKLFTDRYTWTSVDPDDVTQLVERSTDGGPFAGGPLCYHRTPNPTVPPSAVRTSCTNPANTLFQEFDFTVGDWSVEVDGPGQSGVQFSAHQPTESAITKDLDGCLYEEKLTGFQGYEARVFTNLRPIDEIWRRTYVDNRGLRIYVTGPRIQDGKITLSGSMPKAGGGTQDVRATFAAVDATHFTERWERATADGGWEPLVTATYSKR